MAVRARNISKTEWDRLKPYIEELYSRDVKPKLTRKYIAEEMRKKHGLVVTDKQFRTQLEKWGFTRYKPKKKIMKCLKKQMEDRNKAEKKPAPRCRGRILTEDDIESYFKSKHKVGVSSRHRPDNVETFPETSDLQKISAISETRQFIDLNNNRVESWLSDTANSFDNSIPPIRVQESITMVEPRPNDEKRHLLKHLCGIIDEAAWPSPENHGSVKLQLLLNIQEMIQSSDLSRESIFTKSMLIHVIQGLSRRLGIRLPTLDIEHVLSSSCAVDVGYSSLRLISSHSLDCEIVWPLINLVRGSVRLQFFAILPSLFEIGVATSEPKWKVFIDEESVRNIIKEDPGEVIEPASETNSYYIDIEHRMFECGCSYSQSSNMDKIISTAFSQAPTSRSICLDSLRELSREKNFPKPSYLTKKFSSWVELAVSNNDDFEAVQSILEKGGSYKRIRNQLVENYTPATYGTPEIYVFRLKVNMQLDDLSDVSNVLISRKSETLNTSLFQLDLTSLRSLLESNDISFDEWFLEYLESKLVVVDWCCHKYNLQDNEDIRRRLMAENMGYLFGVI